jgi:hypothetical protein
MDWSGMLGFAIALGVISLVSWSAEKFMGYLEPLKFDRSLNVSPREIPKVVNSLAQVTYANNLSVNQKE